MSTSVRQFEIINPSDECYVYSEDPLVAAAAVCILGGGAYPMKEVGSSFEMPLFLFSDADDWWKEKAKMTFKQYMENNKKQIAQCLGTFKYPHERTSMNNIGARAVAWEKALSK